MKNYLIIIFLLLCSSFLGAQTQPIEKVEVEMDPLIMDSYDYATGRMNDVDWIMKIVSDDGWRFGFEYKLSKSLSVNTKTDLSLLRILIAEENRSNLGIRHYFGHVEKINNKKQGNNFNGSYLELGSSLVFSSNFPINVSPFLSVGLQSRFLKYGLIDTGVRFSYNTRSETARITSGFDLGFAISKNYKLQQVEDNKCAVVRCFEEQSYMFKSQISRLLDVSISSQYLQFRIRPNFEFEHRIARVGLSMNHEVVMDFNYSNSITAQVTNYATAEFVFRSGIRWYVGKKRRIIKGKTSNNFSGFYMGPIGDVGILIGEYTSIKLKNGEFWSAGFNLGYQSRLLKNLYIKFNMGMMYREYFNNDPLDIGVFAIDPDDPLNFTVPTGLLKLAIDDRSEIKLIGGLVVGYSF